MAEPGEQDKLTDNWNPTAGTDVDGISADWAAMLETDPTKGSGDGGPDRVLNQDEIDSLLGFDASTSSAVFRLSSALSATP